MNIESAINVVGFQGQDEFLWRTTKTPLEEYLQLALSILHEAVEKESGK